MVKAQISNFLHSDPEGETVLNEALRLIRVFHDVPQNAMAARLQISAPYLSEIESGNKEPTLALLRKYSEEFNIPISSIMFFSEHMQDGEAGSRLRTSISGKVLALLKFIAAKSGRDAA
jgi:transcriptional regulator with XRE-family HTH domain